MSKAEADESFVYADADGNEEVSEKELLTWVDTSYGEDVRVLSIIIKHLHSLKIMRNSHAAGHNAPERS